MFLWRRWGSNPRPYGCQPNALANWVSSPKSNSKIQYRAQQSEEGEPNKTEDSGNIWISHQSPKGGRSCTSHEVQTLCQVLRKWAVSEEALCQEARQDWLWAGVSVASVGLKVARCFIKRAHWSAKATARRVVCKHEAGLGQEFDWKHWWLGEGNLENQSRVR